MLLTPKVTEERKRTSSVTENRVLHIDIKHSANNVSGPTADRVATTTKAARRWNAEAVGAVTAIQAY